MRGACALLVSGGLVVGLLASEALLASFRPQLSQRPPVWGYDELLGWAHIADAAGRQVGPEFDVEYRINAAGLRDRPVPPQPPEAGERLLVFGDSFVEGWGVEVEQTVSGQLRQILAGDQVLNFGVAGYGTDQEMLLFQKEGAAFHPDCVVVCYYANDMWNNVSDWGIGTEQGYKPHFSFAAGGRLRLKGVPVPRTRYWDEDYWEKESWDLRLQHYLTQQWHLYVLARKALTPEMSREEHGQFYDALYGLDAEGRYERAWEASGILLSAFKTAVEKGGARFMLVYVPAIVQVEAEEWAPKLRDLVGRYDLLKPNKRLGAIAARYGIDFLDLYPAFEEEARSQPLYYRDSHWNPAGHDLAARQIAARLGGRQ